MNLRAASRTRTRLIEFYASNQHFLADLSSAEDTLRWELIFVHFFGEMPQHDPTKSVPSYYRPGSTDPRWDDLFFKQHALTVHRKLLERHARTNFLMLRIKEAA